MKCTVLSVMPDGTGFSPLALSAVRGLATFLECSILIAARPDDVRLVLPNSNRFPVTSTHDEFTVRDQLLEHTTTTEYCIFADLTRANDKIDYNGVLDALKILESGMLDVVTANQHLYYFDRQNLRTSSPPWRSYWPSDPIVPVISSYGGLAIYRRNSIGPIRFRGTQNFVAFNSALSESGAKIAIVPWMINAGNDPWYLTTTIAVLMVIFSLIIATKFYVI